MVWTDSYRFVTLCNMVLDLIARRDYVFYCPIGNYVQQNQPVMDYIRTIDDAHLAKIKDNMTSIKNNITNYSYVGGQLEWVIDQVRNYFDIKNGIHVWTLDLWFDCRIDFAWLVDQIYDNANLEYLTMRPEFLSQTFNDGGSYFLE